MKKTSGKRGAGRGKQGGNTSASTGCSGKKPRKSGSTLPGWLPDLPARPNAAASGKGKRVATYPTAPRFDPHAQREAQRYDNPIASREMILQVLAAHAGPMSTEELAQQLALTADDRYAALEKRL